MEFGPRALGNRSILADPRDPNMQTRLNLQIKKRESFRPFAPAVLRESCGQYFEVDMDFTIHAHYDEGQKTGLMSKTLENGKMTLNERLSQKRSDIPAVTHVDYSARIQNS